MAITIGGACGSSDEAIKRLWFDGTTRCSNDNQMDPLS